jgi:protein-S-isoprenylcysteine O-methyltransferase Ste14
VIAQDAGLRTLSQGWKRAARRIRVPLGFAFVVFYFWLARPTAISLLLSLILVVPGILLRGRASGFVRKNADLTTAGPYAHTRNPLYLGSILIAFGFAVAACSIWIAVALAVLFTAIYWPVILGEEEFLRARFPSYVEYESHVPRLLPRLGKYAQRSGEGFSWARYRGHREFNALLGALCVYVGLVLRIVF